MSHGEWRVEAGGEPGVFGLHGRLDLEAARTLEGEVGPPEQLVQLDLRGVSSFTGGGIAGLLRLLQTSPRLRLKGASAELQQAFAELPVEELLEAPRLRPSIEEEPFLEAAGGGWLEFRQAGRFFISLGGEFLYWVFLAPSRGHRLRLGRAITELNRVGVEAIPIVGTIAALIGVILALNAAKQLADYGAEEFTARMVGIALTRELAPVITAILVAGRSGSAIAAEVATMVVTEETDALKVMGINPRAFLVVPKLLALVVALPCLVILSSVVGIGGGFLVALSALDLSFAAYWTETVAALHLEDVVLGLLKAVVFGLLIGLTAATLGLRVRGGASGVGRVTTTSVVTSFFLVIIANTFFTYLFFLLDL